MSIILERYDTLTISQCSELIETNRHKVERSTIYGGENKRVISSDRTNYNTLLDKNIILDSIEAKLETILCINRNQLETWQISRYQKGEYFKPHYDWIERGYKSFYSQGGQRLFTIIVYLSEVVGGETHFPLLERSIIPVPGLMVIWSNVLQRKLVLHESKPVISGEKWILVTWVRENKYTKSHIKS